MTDSTTTQTRVLIIGTDFLRHGNGHPTATYDSPGVPAGWIGRGRRRCRYTGFAVPCVGFVVGEVSIENATIVVTEAISARVPAAASVGQCEMSRP